MYSGMEYKYKFKYQYKYEYICIYTYILYHYYHTLVLFDLWAPLPTASFQPSYAITRMAWVAHSMGSMGSGHPMQVGIVTTAVWSPVDGGMTIQLYGHTIDLFTMAYKLARFHILYVLYWNRLYYSILQYNVTKFI